MRLFDIYAGSPGPTSDQQVTLIDTVGNQSQVPYSWLVKTFNDNMSSIGFQLGGQTLSIQQIASKIVRNDMPPTPPNIVSPPSQPAPVLTVAAVAAAPLPVAAPPATPAPAASPAVPVAPQAAPAAVSPSPLPPITTLILPSVRDWMRRLRTIRTADTATHMGKKMPLVDFFAAAATDSTLQPAKPDQKITFRDTDGNKTTKRVADVLTGLRAGHLQVQPAGPGRISRALGLVKRKAINTAFWPFGNFKRLIVTAAIAATGVVVYQYATRDTMPDDVARLVAAEAAQNAPISAADSRRGAVEGYVSASGLDANNPAVYPNEATATAISMYRPAVVAAYGALKKELNISAESQQVAGADEVRLINTQLRLMIETNLASQPANLDRVGAMTKAASASYRIRKELLGSDASQTGTAEYASAKDVTPTDFAAALLLANIDPTIATQVTQISDLAPAYKRAAQLLTDSSVAVPANIAQGMPVAPASGSLGAGATPPPATQPTKPNTAEDLAKEIFGP